MAENIQSAKRRGTGCYKWDLYGDDILPLWVADTDFTSPKAVIEALRKRVDHGVFGYPMDPPELASLVVARMQDRYGWKISENDLIFIPGVVPGFNLVCQAVMKPGESMIIQTPVYPPFLSVPKNADVHGIFCGLEQTTDGTYEVNFSDFEASIQQDTRFLLFCNPHNPVGKVFSQAELERIAEICLRHQLIICSDEIHSDLIFSGSRHIPIASLSSEIGNNTITLIAPSKTFNIAGLECSILICTNPELREKVQKARRGILGGVNLMGLAAGIAAYKDGSEWLIEMMQILESNRDFLADFLEEHIPQIKMRKPDATYLAWLDCRALDLEEGPYKFFLDNAKVALNNGEDFGEEGKGFVRLNFGCTREILEEALIRMEKAINQR